MFIQFVQYVHQVHRNIRDVINACMFAGYTLRARVMANHTLRDVTIAHAHNKVTLLRLYEYNVADVTDKGLNKIYCCSHNAHIRHFPILEIKKKSFI